MSGDTEVHPYTQNSLNEGSPGGGRMRGMMKVTTKDLAELCGVSRTTVTRALYGNGRISPETRRRILDMAVKLGYEPDLTARSLALGRSMMIGVIVVDLRNQYFPRIVDAIERRVWEEDYILNITLHEDDKEMERKLIRTLVGHRVDGLILNPINKGEDFLHMMENVRIPWCVLGLDELPGSPCVGVDEYEAAERAAGYILQKGYRRVAFVVPPLYDKNGILNLGHHRRRDGFVSVMRRAGCEFQVIHGNDYLQQVLDWHRRGGTQKNAFLCSGAIFAAEVMSMMNRNGFRAPENYGLMGFDSIEFERNLEVRLTTLDNHTEQMGCKAGEMLLKLIRKEETERRIVIPCDIIEGQTL